jgi:signal transduction histidine kinase
MTSIEPMFTLVFDELSDGVCASDPEGRLKGTGLGLAFCREALKAMHGEIRVESQPGSGSTFAVLLPSVTQARGEN